MRQAGTNETAGSFTWPPAVKPSLGAAAERRALNEK
jgi:hypothetical protein